MSQRGHLAITVLGATDLPNADMFGKTDGYVKVIIPGQLKQRTATKNDTLNPVWTESFGLTEVPLDAAGVPSVTIMFELWDANVLKDVHMGTAQVTLSAQHFARPGLPMELPFSFTKSKWRKARSFLRVVFSWVLSFDTLLASHPTAFGDIAQRRFYLPLPHLGPVVLALEYETAALDVKLYITQPNTGLYLDMSLATATKHVTKLRRREGTSGVPFYGNMVYYEEIKLDDVPLWEDLSRLQIMVMRKKVEEEVNLDTVVSRHGWKGAMGWRDASAKLHGVELDRQKEEVYMPMPGSFIVVDYDADNVDMKVVVLDIPENASTGFDLTLHGNVVKKTSQIYNPSIMALGKYLVQRKLELDDVPFGTAFKDMVWRRYSLLPAWSGSLGGLIKLR
jgi:hypothetical protein